MNNAYIALGTNIEPRSTYIQKALGELVIHKDIQLIKESSIYETAPVGYLDQAHFLNLVIEVKTSLSAFELLKTCQAIETKLGRERNVRFGPRTIDLDILLYNDENINTKTLTIPHPRMHERAFVLVPLDEIAPAVRIPTHNKSVSQMLSNLSKEELADVVICRIS